MWKKAYPTEDFKGIVIEDLEKAEHLFKVNVDIFEFDEEVNPPIIVPIRRSPRNHDKTMQLVKYKEHFCFVNDINKAGHAFSCPKCRKLWKEEFMLRRHEETCTSGGQKHVYPGGVYTPTRTPLEILAENGIAVNTKYAYPYRATFDYEVFFEG